MKIRHRIAVLPVLAALALAACAQDPGAEDSGVEDPGASPDAAAQGAELVIGLTYTPDVQFAPFYVAEAKGYYAESGVEVTLRHHGASESLFGALEAGEEDLVVAGGDEMLQARSAGVPVVSAAQLYEDYPVVLIVPADSPIQEPADLAGHSVGLPGPYGETWFWLLALLAEADLTQEDVQIEHIGFTQQAALSAGHVDSVVGFANNDLVQFQNSSMDVRALGLDGVPLVGTAIGVHDDAFDDDAAAVAAVLAATFRGVQDTAADPEGAVEIASQYVPGLVDPAAREAARVTLDATIELYGAATGRQDLRLWQEMALFMAEHGLLEGEVDVAAAVSEELLG